jgi:hypothetical protein
VSFHISDLTELKFSSDQEDVKQLLGIKMPCHYASGWSARHERRLFLLYKCDTFLLSVPSDKHVNLAEGQ